VTITKLVAALKQGRYDEAVSERISSLHKPARRVDGVLNRSGGRRLRLPSKWRTGHPLGTACSVHTRVNAICFTAPQARFRQIEPAPPKRLRTRVDVGECSVAVAVV
jgi:hypothetical protein